MHAHLVIKRAFPSYSPAQVPECIRKMEGLKGIRGIHTRGSLHVQIIITSGQRTPLHQQLEALKNISKPICVQGRNGLLSATWELSIYSQAQKHLCAIPLGMVATAPVPYFCCCKGLTQGSYQTEICLLFKFTTCPYTFLVSPNPSFLI